MASGGGDGRVAFAATPSGRFALQLQANGVLETLSQTVTVAGAAGETYALTLQAMGAGLTPGEAVSVTLRSELAGVVVNSVTCTFPFPAIALSATPACEIGSTVAFDALEVALTWDGVAAGTLTLDAMSLVQR